MTSTFKIWALLTMFLVAGVAGGCGTSGPNRVRFVKTELSLDGALRRSGRAEYVALSTSNMAAMSGLGFELPDDRVVAFSEVSIDWLRTHSPYVTSRGYSGSAPKELASGVLYHFWFDEQAYRFGVRDGEIFNFGMNPAPLGLGLKLGVLWDLESGTR